jgi:peptidyl-prolyl cis-trans isomerase B (cyclophilin B)
MKKLTALILIMIMGVTLLSGCSKKKDSTSQSPDTQNTSDSQNSAENDPQLSKPKKGETVAEIVIKGYGSIFVKFFNDAAPKAVENFVTHAKEGYYEGLTFHRIINDFMIQGGDPTGTGMGGESIWGDNFEDEFSEDLQPLRGALCMANSGPNTNGSQFFIVQTKQTYTQDILSQIEQQYGVKFNDKAVKNYGTVGGTPWLYKMHTVFGQVYDGYDVLDAVAAVKVTNPDSQDYTPVEDVIIEKIKVSEYK